MRTLPREPWRGGQICGYQTAYGLPWSIFCGEMKKPGSPLCEEHDHDLRGGHGGGLPRFAPGNALGLRLTSCSGGWLVRDEYDDLIDASDSRNDLARQYGFTLLWEPYEEGEEPSLATEEEVRKWKESAP